MNVERQRGIEASSRSLPGENFAPDHSYQAAASPALSFQAHNPGALGLIWHLYQINVDVLNLISARELASLDAVQAFDGLYSWPARNIARPRRWMPRLVPLAVDLDAALGMRS